VRDQMRVPNEAIERAFENAERAGAVEWWVAWCDNTWTVQLSHGNLLERIDRGEAIALTFGIASTLQTTRLEVTA